MGWDRGKQCAQVGGHRTRKVGVDDEHLVATGELEGRLHRGALPASRIGDRLGAGVGGERRARGVSGDDERAADDDRGREDVRQHREGQIAPRAARRIQARLPLCAGERHDHRRHRESVVAWLG